MLHKLLGGFTMTLQKRDAIDATYKWDLTHIFASMDEWENAYQTIEKNITLLGTYEGKISTSAAALRAFLDLKTETSLLFEKIAVYARMQEDENTKDSKRQALVQRIQPLGIDFSSTCAFFDSEFLSIEEKTLQAFYEQEEGLRFYQDYLEEINREKAHILSKEQEEVLAQTGLLYTADDTFRKLENADLTFEPIVDEKGEPQILTNGTYSTFISSEDRAVRKQAFTNLYRSYKGVKNTIASTMIGNLQKDLFYSKIRKYGSSLEAALFGDNVPVDVYNNLIETVRKKTPILHQYVSLRKKLLNVEELHMYDMYAPLVNGYDEKIPYEKAYDTMVEALHVLGDDYVARLQEARTGGWIDVYETEGKRGGAYSWGPYGTHPYVLLNHTDDLDSLFTLAHEMGHALHSAYSDANLPYLYAGYSIFVAEVASTVNEVLLMRHLLANSEDKQMKIYLINEFIDKFKGTLFRQTQFAEFEKITHEKIEANEPLTGDDLNELYLQLNKDYYGDGVVHDDEIAYEWSRIPHFYNAFYVYQYATGFSAAIAIADRILKEGEPAVAAYKQFLSSGGSDYPIELLKIAGVDMSTAEPIERALQVFEELVEELDTLTK